MNRERLYSYLTGLFITLFVVPYCAATAQAKEFVVVIDAGHGGHDPGAIGRISKEKNINLSVALKLGKAIDKQCPGTKVIYTRKTDVFIPLDTRAQIANDAGADLFISIHTNALPKAKSHISGTSTWTLGLAKSEANLDVAKRENSVILYESDYKTRYAGFNPNSSESYIIFEFMQDKYMEQSVHLASLVQKEFKGTGKRIDRGVHQAGFLVLKASSMPGVLVELGFISNPDEERYLNSDAGTTALANSVLKAVLAYKREQDLRQDGTSDTPAPVDTDTVTDEADVADVISSKKEPPVTTPRQTVVERTTLPVWVFKVQLLTSAKKLSPNDHRLKGVKGVEYYKEGGLYKYTCGASKDYNQVTRTRREMAKRFKGAFIVAFKGDKKVDVHEAIRAFQKSNKNK
jgi:N-acetylmuramoyl-L-alanine amidase